MKGWDSNAIATIAKKRKVAPHRTRKQPTQGMNKLEGRFYSEQLANAGWDWIAYEANKYKLAKRTFYTPDFVTVSENGIFAWEVKGFWEDDARVKVKLFAEKYPWIHVTAVTWDRKNKEWKYERFDWGEVG